VFSGANYYTRRGDFELDNGGYLVNGSGYYLKGLPIDPTTQNISGSVPQVLRLDNAFLPAQQTTRINYQLNLPQLPKTDQYKESQAVGSELLNAGDFVSITPDTPATDSSTATTLTGATLLTDASIGLSNGQTLIIGDGNAADNHTFNVGPASTLQNLIDGINGQANLDVTASLVGGQLVLTADNNVANITVAGTGTFAGIAPQAPTVSDALRLSTRVSTIAAEDADEFNAQSIAGGALTVYAENGAPANVQMRWAKVNSTANGGAERWNLFISTDTAATGTQPMWTRVGGDYTFGSNGSPNPAVDHTDLTALTVNGVLIGDVRLQHGANGLTQFADPNGASEVTALNQNGYAAGEFVSVAVNDNGRVVVSYNNGQQLEIAQVVTANFNAANQLKRMDGGVFAATSESGEPILDNDGGIIGASLEASNTDISEEFTKLIVTQQAYAAGTRIVSTADEMLQEALNMVR
jgi:flagellar hook protein FlgE